jgi:hypothetical protein
VTFGGMMSGGAARIGAIRMIAWIDQAIKN